jgi:hypothetical protein
MYTIKASARTSVRRRSSEPGRRYGVVARPPPATLYDERTLAILDDALADRRGLVASEAARHRGRRSGRATRGPGRPGAQRGRLVARFVAAAESTSPVETEAVSTRSQPPARSSIVDILLPAVALGRLGQAG